MCNSKYVQCRNSLGSDKGVGGSVIYSNDEKYEENDFPPSINATIWNNFGSDCC